MGATVNVNSINYRDQAYFNQFFATSFDRYDRNRDGRIDYREFQPLVNEMCNMIIQRYGNGPTVDKIRQAWYAMDINRSGYITRQEFSTKAKREVERILTNQIMVMVNNILHNKCHLIWLILNMDHLIKLSCQLMVLCNMDMGHTIRWSYPKLLTWNI